MFWKLIILYIIKSDILGGFFNFKTILIISCNHDNTSCLEFSKARDSACMYFLVNFLIGFNVTR